MEIKLSSKVLLKVCRRMLSQNRKKLMIFREKLKIKISYRVNSETLSLNLYSNSFRRKQNSYQRWRNKNKTIWTCRKKISGKMTKRFRNSWVIRRSKKSTIQNWKTNLLSYKKQSSHKVNRRLYLFNKSILWLLKMLNWKKILKIWTMIYKKNESSWAKRIKIFPISNLK